MDRRSHERLWVQVRCFVQLSGRPGRRVMVTTKNISRGGVLICWPKTHGQFVPQVGEVVRTDIPMLATPGLGRRYLECVGEVLRVSCDDEEEQVLIAVRFRRMRVKAAKVMLTPCVEVAEHAG